MTIQNNASHATSIPFSPEGHQTPSSINNRVEGVAFDVLFSQEPETEQLRFELTESKKTGSQYYRIVLLNGKKHRITVFDKGNKLAYSEGDWQRVEHLTTKLVERYHKNKDFPEKSKGTLSLKERKWTVTYGDRTPTIERSVNKRVIREFKKLFEDQIKPTNILPATKAPLKRKASNLAALDTPSKQAKTEETSFAKKIIEKAKNFLFRSKSNTDEDMEETEKEKGPLEKAKDHLFPSTNLDDWDSLSSSDTASISSFEELENPTDDLDDNTSLGGITVASSHISNDSGSSYSPGKR